MSPNDHPVRRHVRSTLGAVVVTACTALLLSTAPAAAAVGRSAAPAAPTCPSVGNDAATGAIDIMPGVGFGPALVVTPGKPNRTLSASAATAFIQSWLPASVFQHLAHVPKPAGVPISHLYMITTFQNAQTCIVAWYAARGSDAWVGMPAQSLGWASVQQDTWIAAPIPARTIAAFAGKVKPEPVATGTTPTTAAGKAAKSGSGGSSSNGALYAIPVVIVAAIGGWLFVRGRSRAARTG